MFSVPIPRGSCCNKMSYLHHLSSRRFLLDFRIYLRTSFSRPLCFIHDTLLRSNIDKEHVNSRIDKQKNYDYKCVLIHILNACQFKCVYVRVIQGGEDS